MSETTKTKLMKLSGISSDVADVLEAAGLVLPRDIKLADDADLEAAGLSKDEVKEVRKKCKAYKSHGSNP